MFLLSKKYIKINHCYIIYLFIYYICRGLKMSFWPIIT